MNTNIQALQELYVKLGGSLTDTYDDIADGAPVSDYTVIPDMIAAVTQVAGSGGGGGASDPILPIMLANALSVTSAYDEATEKTFYFLSVRHEEQRVPGGMENISWSDLQTQIDSVAAGDNKSAQFLQMCFKRPADYGAGYPSWAEEPMKAIVNAEADSTFALWQQIAEIINNSPKSPYEFPTWSADPKVEAGRAILALNMLTDVDVSNMLNNYDNQLNVEGTLSADGNTLAFTSMHWYDFAPRLNYGAYDSADILQPVVYAGKSEESGTYKVRFIIFDGATPVLYESTASSADEPTIATKVTTP